MFTHLAQHPVRLLGIALLVPLSLALTLLAVLDLPAAQANHHATVSAPSISLGDPSAPAGSVDVAISGFTFNPSVITITAGTVVTWTNLDGFAHTTTSDAGSSDPWDSGALAPNATFTRTFNVPGVYGYHCTIHLGMQGTVVVLAPPPPQAPLALNVSGPRGGAADVAHTFAATVSPITTTQPITYIWEATGQTIVTSIDKGLSDTISFTWTAAQLGSQLITVTATNSEGSISATYTTTIVPPAGTGVTDVSIVDFAFQPRWITITAGLSIRWINAGQLPHTATSDISSPQSWDSGALQPGEVFTETFNTPGSYPYHCTFHPGMLGTVTVLTEVYVPLILR
jgi:plastocyanin